MKFHKFTLACSLLVVGSQLLQADSERRRTLPNVQVNAPVVVETGFSAMPADLEFFKRSGLQLPLVPFGQTSLEENTALAVALTSYKAGGLAYDFGPIDAFLEDYPNSPWQTGLLANKGLVYRYNGFIGSSFPVFEKVWQLAKDAENISIKAYADRSIAELIAIKAGLGRQDELDLLFAEVKDRILSGKAAELVANAKMGLASMRNNPGRSFNCGPAALVNVLHHLDHIAANDERIMEKAATSNGLSLRDVAELSDQVGFSDYSLGFRESTDTAYITPSIVHWKEGHFSALLEHRGDRYLIEDPTLGRKIWVPREALDIETSGYFFVAQANLPEGWRVVDFDEVTFVYGKGKTNMMEDGSTRPSDEKTCEKNNLGMPGYSVHLALVSVSVTDTPLWVNTPYGFPVNFTLSYNQRETSLLDPASANHGNLGSNWTHNWHSWLSTSGPVTANVGPDIVTIAVLGGGSETFTLDGNAYKQQRDTQSILTATFDSDPLSPTGFVLTFLDGSKYTYGLDRINSDNFYLTEMEDPYENTVTLNYDADYRLTTIQTDALAHAPLTFVYAYEAGGSPDLSSPSAALPEDYLIKEVIDSSAGPGQTGRYTKFNYDENLRIDSITDMAGLEATFVYGSSYLSRMHTPYGQTTFEYPDNNGNVTRSVVITDPQGQQERVEYTQSVITTNFYGTEDPPTGAFQGSHFSDDLNTFYWDKRAMETAVNSDNSMDYSQAVVYHWMLADTQLASSVLHSVKRPLENRDWYIYPDSSGVTIGSTNQPSAIKRFVKNELGATVARTVSFEYNALGKPTNAVDPKGREVKMTYATNGIDLLTVQQRVMSDAEAAANAPPNTDPNAFQTLVTFDGDNDTYDVYPHLPSVIEGVDGILVDVTYNSKGQLLSATRKAPDGAGGYTDEGTTDYTYLTAGTGETYGFLQKVEGPSVGGSRPTTTYTYDIDGRVRTSTDTDNFTLTFDYDDLNRVTKVSYPDGTYVANFYEPFSEGLDLLAFRDRLGRMSQFRHDAVGRVVQSIDPKGQSTIYNWCGCGSLTSITDPLGKTTTWMRDVQGRVEKKIYDDDSEISFTYEPESGFLSTVTDQRGYVKNFTYFVDGNLEEISYDDGNLPLDAEYIDTPTVTYDYDNLNDPNDQYFNRPYSVTTAGDPDDYIYQYYGFTGDGNANRLETVTISKIRDAQTITNDIDYVYDSLGRLDSRDFKGATETYAYDSLDRLDNLSDPLGDFDYSYEGLTARILAVQHSVASVNGIRTDLGYAHKTAGGQEREVPFLNNITHSTTTGTIAAHSYVRNDNGWIDLWQQFDGANWQSHSYRYDQEGQLETDRKFDGLDGNSPLLERNEFRYDRSGNRTLVQYSTNQLNAEHNDLNQLTARSGEGGTLFHGTISEAGKVFVQQLDGSSNVTESTEAQLYGGNEFYANIDLPVGSNTVRIKATDIHGETSQQDYTVPVVADPGESFLYDLAGNLTDWTKADGTQIEYKWDAANRLRGIEVDSVLIQSFEYDGAGRMTRATDASGNRNDYYWDGLERLGRENVDVSPTVYRRYLTSGFTESLDGAAAQNYYVTRDHLGSTREVLDDTYATVAKYDYSAWGEVTKLSGSVDADQLYTGHLYFADSDTPLHLAPYRAYEPELGRWLSRDFLGEIGPDGTNVYGYARNSPVNGIDPTGLAWESTQTQGLHYNDRNSKFGFGLEVSGGKLTPVPLGGSHTFDGPKARGILNNTIKDKKKWKLLRAEQARNYDDPSYRDKSKCKKVGRGMRVAGALGGVGLAVGVSTSKLDKAAMNYINARGHEQREVAALQVVEEASRIGAGPASPVIYRYLTE